MKKYAWIIFFGFFAFLKLDAVKLDEKAFLLEVQKKMGEAVASHLGVDQKGMTAERVYFITLVSGKKSVVKQYRHKTYFEKELAKYEAFQKILETKPFEIQDLFARYLGSFELGGAGFILFEHAEGVMVADFFEAFIASNEEKRKQYVPYFQSIGRELARFHLAFMNEDGMTLPHRDLHGENIFYNQETEKMILIDYADLISMQKGVPVLKLEKPSQDMRFFSDWFQHDWGVKHQKKLREVWEKSEELQKKYPVYEVYEKNRQAILESAFAEIGQAYVKALQENDARTSYGVDDYGQNRGVASVRSSAMAEEPSEVFAN